MAAYVSFFTPAGIGAIEAPGIGNVRLREAVTVPGSTSASCAPDEAVMVYNGESTAIFIAFGTTPDAAATSATLATTAGFPVGPGTMSPPFIAPNGAKFNIKVAT